jgi:hypothetical protein
VSITALHTPSQAATATKPDGQASPARRDARPGPHTDPPLQADPRLTHLLRLSLDLQLDAMLFMLGAAATHHDPAAEAAPAVVDLDRAEGAVQGDVAVPWRRWMTEDLELSRCLASTAANIGLALPPTLGRAGRHEDSRLVAEDLIARYEFMANLLEDLTERAAVSTPQTLLAPVADALTRIRSRLEELRAAAALPPARDA